MCLPMYWYMFAWACMSLSLSVCLCLCLCLCLYLCLCLCLCLLCFARGLGREQSSRPAGALPHPSFGMDGLGLYRTVCPWCSEVLAVSVSVSVCLSICRSLSLSDPFALCIHVSTHTQRRVPAYELASRVLGLRELALCTLLGLCRVQRRLPGHLCGDDLTFRVRR